MSLTLSLEQTFMQTNECRRCGHTWVPRGEAPPAQCPKCKSTKWAETVPQSGAHSLVAQAIRRGDLPALDGSTFCMDCGEPATCYDHRDYNYPLLVDPVCHKCNRQRGEGLNRIGPRRRYQEMALTELEWRQFRTIAAAREMTQVDLATSIMRAAIQAEFESGETQ